MVLCISTAIIHLAHSHYPQHNMDPRRQFCHDKVLILGYMIKWEVLGVQTYSHVFSSCARPPVLCLCLFVVLWHPSGYGRWIVANSALFSLHYTKLESGMRVKMVLEQFRKTTFFCLIPEDTSLFPGPTKGTRTETITGTERWVDLLVPIPVLVSINIQQSVMASAKWIPPPSSSASSDSFCNCQNSCVARRPRTASPFFPPSHAASFLGGYPLKYKTPWGL